VLAFPQAERYAQVMSERVATLHAAVSRDGDWYVAQCLEVDVASQGETIEDALANLREALELYFEDEPVPKTPQPTLAPVEVRLPA
jgi:predicted RNase H-like HicB family nuclease